MMKYGLTKKLVFALHEYYYKPNYMVEQDLCNIIYELEKEDWNDLRINYKECIHILQQMPSKYNERQLYSWVQDCDHFIQHLEYLPVMIAEEQAERQIAYAEALGDYIYENGYSEYMTHGF